MTEKHKNKVTHGKTYNKSPRRINHKATKSKTNTGTIKLCLEAQEARQHFLAECGFLTIERQSYIEKLTTQLVLTDAQIQQLNEPEFLTQLTLDASKVIDIEKLREEQLRSLELYTREYERIYTEFTERE